MKQIHELADKNLVQIIFANKNKFGKILVKEILVTPEFIESVESKIIGMLIKNELNFFNYESVSNSQSDNNS